MSGPPSARAVLLDALYVWRERAGTDPAGGIARTVIHYIAHVSAHCPSPADHTPRHSLCATRLRYPASVHHLGASGYSHRRSTLLNQGITA